MATASLFDRWARPHGKTPARPRVGAEPVRI